MKRTSFDYSRLTNMTVGLKSQRDYNHRTLHGRITINMEERHALFVRYPQRGARSKELMRTAHSRMVTRPDGNFTLTFRFSPIEDNLPEKLLDEMKTIIGQTINNNNTTEPC